MTDFEMHRTIGLLDFPVLQTSVALPNRNKGDHEYNINMLCYFISVTCCSVSAIVSFASADAFSASSIEANKAEKFLTVSAGCSDKAGIRML